MLDLAIIGGRVVDEAGAPVRGALVGAAGRADRNVARTNDQGRFTLGLLAAEPVRVVARKPGFLFGIAGRVDPWTLNLELRLARGGSVSGRVTGDPLPRRWRVRLSGRGTIRWGSTLCRGGGLFSVTRVPAGRYDVLVDAPGHRLEVPVSIDLGPGESIEGLDLRLRPA